MTRKHLFFIASLFVTLGVSYSLLKYVSLADLKQLLWEMDRGALFAFITLSFCMSSFRTWRYQILLKTTGQSVPNGVVFLIVLVRNFFSDLSRKSRYSNLYLPHSPARGVSIASATTSFAYAFVFDIIALAPLLLLALLFIGQTALPFGILASAGVTIATLLVLGMWFFPNVLARCNTWMSRFEKTPKKFLQLTLAFLKGIETNVNETHCAGVYGKLLALSLMVRVCKYTAFYVFLFGLLAPQGIGMLQLPPSSVFLGICAAEFSASLPISGIGGFGLYEGTWTVVFRLLGFPLDLAALTALSHHLFTQVFGYTLGVGALLILLLPIPWNSRKRAFFRLPFPVAFTLALFLTTVLPSFAYWASSSPSQREPTDTKELRLGMKSPELARKLGARILFDSNRNGNFGIFALDPKSGKITTIVDSETHEIYPDPSPDGSMILFARTRSLQRQAPSNIWIADLQSKSTRLLIKDGTFPTFSADGAKVYFERRRKKIFSFDLATQEETLLFPSERNIFGGKQVVKPRISPDGRFVAFTSDRSGKWNAWYSNLSTGAFQHIGHGCEPAWYHNGLHLAFVSTRGAKSGSGIYRYSQVQSGAVPLHDRGSPMGHEYFPTLSENDRYLLFSACPDNQHSHESANYQIFVRELSSDSVYQLTNDTFTNRWPKILKGNLCREKICMHIKP